MFLVKKKRNALPVNIDMVEKLNNRFTIEKILFAVVNIFCKHIYTLKGCFKIENYKNNGFKKKQ